MFAKSMISCEIGSGTSYINQHGVTGLVIPPESPQDLAEAIERMDRNPDLTRAMGQAARLRYEELFTGRKMATAYLNAYQRMLAT